MYLNDCKTHLKVNFNLQFYGISSKKDFCTSIKNNIYINGKFVDKFKDDIINILYQKKEK